MNYAHGSISWVDLTSPNIDEAIVFYLKIFGWESPARVPSGHPGQPDYGLFTLGGKRVAGVGQMPEESKAAGTLANWNSYVAVDDINVILAAATQAGGAVVLPRMALPDGAGALAYFTDPEGATLALFESGTMTGAEIVNRPGCHCWNELLTIDLSSAVAFHGALFGWNIDQHPAVEEEYKLIEVGDGQIGGMRAVDQSVSPYWRVYFAVDDVEAVCERTKSAGGAVVYEPIDTPFGRIAWLRDPHGAEFSVVTFAS